MQKIFKNEKGSISLFVLLSALFFLVIVTSVGVSFKNKERSIDSQFEKIKSGYEKDVGNESVVYNEESKKRVLTLDANGGTIEINGENVETFTKIVKIGENYGELPTPKRDGYTFKGWNGKNLFSGFTKGKIIDSNTGSVRDNYNTGAISDYIYVDFVNQQYYLSGLSNTLYDFVAAYNVNTEFKGRTPAGAYSNRNLSRISFNGVTGTAEGEIEFIRITQYELNSLSGRIDDIDDLNIQLEQGTTATEYEPYFVTSSTKVTQNNNDHYVLTAIWEKNE